MRFLSAAETEGDITCTTSDTWPPDTRRILPIQMAVAARTNVHADDIVGAGQESTLSLDVSDSARPTRSARDSRTSWKLRGY